MPKRKATTLSLFQLTQLFPTVDSAIRYFERVRWDGQPTCAKCTQSKKITAQAKIGTYWCGSCRAYFTVFTGTPFERNKIDARKWLFAAYLMLTARKGISSMQLSKELSVQQRTAWYILHRLRVACDEDSALLSGIVEIDETYIGGKEKNRHQNQKGRHGVGGAGKQVLMGLRQRGGKIVTTPIPNTKTHTLMSTVAQHVSPDAVVCTDTHAGYRYLPHFMAYHGTVNHEAKEYVNGFVHINGMESVWAVLKRGLHGVYHAVSAKHLERYVKEFTFRLNQGNCAVDTADRLDALFGQMPGKTITYKGLTGKG